MLTVAQTVSRTIRFQMRLVMLAWATLTGLSTLTNLSIHGQHGHTNNPASQKRSFSRIPIGAPELLELIGVLSLKTLS
jgi:hypothetical protein